MLESAATVISTEYSPVQKRSDIFLADEDDELGMIGASFRWRKCFAR